MALKSKGKLDFNYDHNKCSVSRTNTDDQLKKPHQLWNYDCFYISVNIICAVPDNVQTQKTSRSYFRLSRVIFSNHEALSVLQQEVSKQIYK